MLRNRLLHTLKATLCLLMLSILLLLSSCGGSSTPSSQPNGTPQTAPTKGGYSLIYLFEYEIQLYLAPQKR
jgi:hypothetical protein